MTSTKLKYIKYYIAIKGRSSMATGNMYLKMVNFGCVVFEICKQTDGQTDRQTC